MYNVYCRTYQTIFKVASGFLPWREPKLLEGEGSIGKLPQEISQRGIKSVLLVTDKGIASLGLMNGLCAGLENAGIQYAIYDKTVPNPTIDNIEEALKLYKENNCQGIIAFGGGSPMDCAKGVGARVANPHKTIPQMKGLLKVRKKIPPLFAIPTTAGTGSEATVAAVITNSATHEKYPVNDLVLIPHVAVLDPTLTVGLPPHITSTTGMDALTHAVEAYIGRSNTNQTRELSRKAIMLIFENIEEAYANGTNLTARYNMQKAAYYAGVAFTRAYVGYVHALAHQLGGFYNTPHGLANAVLLPYVLEYYGESAYKPLAECADLVGITNSSDTLEEKAHCFIEAIRKLNRNMNIPEKIDGIQEKDIPLMVERALQEANPTYPVPRILNKEDLAKLYRMIS